MTNTEKRQDLFNGNFMNNGVEGVLDDKFQDPKMLIVRDFHTESIHQAEQSLLKQILALPTHPAGYGRERMISPKDIEKLL